TKSEASEFVIFFTSVRKVNFIRDLCRRIAIWLRFAGEYVLCLPTTPQRHAYEPPLPREYRHRHGTLAVQRVTYGDALVVDVQHSNVMVEEKRELHERRRVTGSFQFAYGRERAIIGGQSVWAIAVLQCSAQNVGRRSHRGAGLAQNCDLALFGEQTQRPQCGYCGSGSTAAVGVLKTDAVGIDPRFQCGEFVPVEGRREKRPGRNLKEHPDHQQPSENPSRSNPHRFLCSSSGCLW